MPKIWIPIPLSQQALEFVCRLNQINCASLKIDTGSSELIVLGIERTASLLKKQWLAGFLLLAQIDANIMMEDFWSRVLSEVDFFFWSGF